MDLERRLADLICEALNSDVSAEDAMRALRDAENKLAAFMLTPDARDFTTSDMATEH